MQDNNSPQALEELLDYLKRCRGFDFTGYKRSSLERRVQRRMTTIGIESYVDYLDQLEVDQNEFGQLFNTILINVTAFFRDAAAWDYLATEIVPIILKSKAPDAPIRVWSAGCASGEEPFTLSMVLAEAMGDEQFRERVKIYATDADEDALTRARTATYSAREVAGVPPNLLTRYFDRADNQYTFRKEMRRAVIFGRNDLVQDAPISRIDLLVCRNALMYFNAEAQSRILSRFHFALNNDGYLFLGRAETLLTHGNTFIPTELKHRVFAKVPRPNARDRMLVMNPSDGEDLTSALSNHVRVREAAIDACPVAQIVVDTNRCIFIATKRARALLGRSRQDIGRPLQELEVCCRPIELRNLVERVFLERGVLTLKDVLWPVAGAETRWLDVELSCLMLHDSGTLLGASVTFSDVTRAHGLQVDVDRLRAELIGAREELQTRSDELATTNEELQSAVERLETTNEELQSTNEEFETMNEELQSANEELQSTNEELETLNGELQVRSTELNETNSYLESILSSIQSAVIVLDRGMAVRVWNRHAEELWGLKRDEVVAKPFMELDIGLPVGSLRSSIKKCLAGEAGSVMLEIAATNRRGRSILCSTVCSALLGSGGKINGAILVFDAVNSPSN